MGFRDPGVYVIQQNYLIQPYATIGEGSSASGGIGYELENTMNYLPHRVARFDAATGSSTKTIQFMLNEAREVNAIAIIGIHSRDYDVVPIGDIPFEERFKVRLTHSAGATQVWPQSAGSYAYLTYDEIRRHGANIFGFFPITSSHTQYNVQFGLQDGGNIYDLEVGCIMLGRYYAFPTNPVINFDQDVVASTTITGRQGGVVQPFVREESVRSMSIKVFNEDEDSRADMARLFAGRGLRTYGTGVSGANAFMRKRLDVPTALINADMWSDESWNGTTYGGGPCIFGRFDGYRSSSGVAGVAFSQVGFQEIPSPAS